VGLEAKPPLGYRATASGQRSEGRNPEASILGVGVGRDPQSLGRGSWGSQGASLTSHEILLYLIMYRKYFRKCWL